MSRIIRFRVWDKKKKKYLLPEKQEFVILPTRPSFGVTIPFQSVHYPNENLDIDCVDWADADLIMGRYELEQDTGLKDRNGTKIYEGDIVGIYHEYADTDGVKTWEELEPWGQVVYEDNKARFGIWGDSPYADEEKHFFGLAEGLEVIGNIHENPELLEEKE